MWYPINVTMDIVTPTLPLEGAKKCEVESQRERGKDGYCVSSGGAAQTESVGKSSRGEKKNAGRCWLAYKATSEQLSSDDLKRIILLFVIRSLEQYQRM